jgi:TonB family protein
MSRPLQRILLAGAVLAGLLAGPMPRTAAAAEAVLAAHPALRYDPKDRCPELRIADEGDTATVLFVVTADGRPKQASISRASGIEGLDAAALACVTKLKFQPATRPGDAVPVDSWQQLQLRYAAVAHPAAAPVTAAGAVAPAAPAALAVAGAPGPRSTEVQACADAGGALSQEPKVMRSSGDAARDAAALRIARAGAANYAREGKPGCARLTVSFEGP